MALNLQTLRTRALTAVVFVALMLTGLLWNHWSFLALFVMIHIGCWLEYFKLVGLIDARYRGISSLHRWGAILIGLGFMFWMTDQNFRIGNFLLSEIGQWLILGALAGLLVFKLIKTRKPDWQIITYTVLGFLYISMPWGLMMDLRGHFSNSFLAGKGWILPMIIIATIWINDTMAYLVGSLIGKTPFSSISPKKTWEGTVGGAILAVIAVSLAGYYYFHFDTKNMLLITSTAAIMGTAGDLLESKLKRMAGVKDSGQIMPGHGGFLDRFDSLLLATPYVWLVLNLFL